MNYEIFLTACFKPYDEEPYTPNNPRGRELVANFGLVGKESFRMRPGVKPGEGYIREVATYLLDNGFAGVPATGLVEARHKAFNYGVRGKKNVFFCPSTFSEMKKYIE